MTVLIRAQSSDSKMGFFFLFFLYSFFFLGIDMCTLNEMPTEILLMIFPHLGFEELVSLSGTTKRLREVVTDEGLLNHEDVDLTVHNTPARFCVITYKRFFSYYWEGYYS